MRHGMKYTRFYKVWENMHTRVRKPDLYHAKYYHGKTIEKRWNEFLNFYSDMYNSYQHHVAEFGEQQTTIDRINPAKGYSHKNCRWATYTEQNRNKTHIKPILLNGEYKILTDWCRELNIPLGTVTSHACRNRKTLSDSLVYYAANLIRKI